MKITVEGTLARGAEYRRTGAQAEHGVVLLELQSDNSRFPIEARVPQDDAVKGQLMAAHLIRGLGIRIEALSASPRIDHGTVATILTGVTRLTAAGVELPL